MTMKMLDDILIAIKDEAAYFEDTIIIQRADNIQTILKKYDGRPKELFAVDNQDLDEIQSNVDDIKEFTDKNETWIYKMALDFEREFAKVAEE